MTRWNKLDVAAVAAGLLIGIGIGWVDSRPNWDDTGVTVGAIVLSAGLLSLVRPRPWWAIALAIGLPVPLFDALLRGGLDSAVAVVFAFVAAAAGMLVARAAAAAADS